MRKTTLTIFLISVINISFSQSWLDIGLKGGYGMPLLMNMNIWNDGDYNHTFGGSGNFGAKIGLNFDQTHELTVDVLFGDFTQNFTYNVQLDSTQLGDTKYTSSIGYKSTDLLLMYRNNNDGRYTEIGPQVSLIRSGSRTDSNPGAASFDQNDFNSTLFGICGGFGAYFLGTENFGVTAGVRLSYMFSDLISSKGKSDNMPTLKNYSSYKGSYPLYIQLVFEANLDFAYLAKAKCGRRKLLTF